MASRAIRRPRSARATRRAVSALVAPPTRTVAAPPASLASRVKSYWRSLEDSADSISARICLTRPASTAGPPAPPDDERAVAGGDDLDRAAQRGRVIVVAREPGRRPPPALPPRASPPATRPPVTTARSPRTGLAGEPVTGHGGGQGGAVAARPARGQDLKGRAGDPACQHDERPARRGGGVDGREQVLGRGYLGVDEEQKGVAQDRLAALGVGHEPGPDVPAVDGHSFAQREL